MPPLTKARAQQWVLHTARRLQCCFLSQALVQQLSMEDYQSVRLVCVVWMAAARCRHLRLTLSCVEVRPAACCTLHWQLPALWLQASCL